MASSGSPGTVPPGTPPIEREELERRIAEQQLRKVTAEADNEEEKRRRRGGKRELTDDERTERTRREEGLKVPLAITLQHMPADYTATQISATSRAFAAPTGGIITEGTTKKPEDIGALFGLIGGVKKLLERCRMQEARGSATQRVTGEGQPTPGVAPVSVDEVSQVLEALVFNTKVKLTIDEFRALGTIIKGKPTEGYRRKLQEAEAGGSTSVEVNMADALALYQWSGESHEGVFTAGHRQIKKDLEKKILGAVRTKMENDVFTYINPDGDMVSLDRVNEQLDAAGVKFNEYLVKVLGWMARDACQRTQQKYLEITKRIAPQRRYGRYAQVIGVEDPETQRKAREELKLWADAHAENLSEFRDRPDLSIYEYNMAMAWHKGADDREISKGSVLGASNPLWKMDICRHIIEEHMLKFRDHRLDRPNMQNETESQRELAQSIWDRLDNVVLRDERDGVYRRDDEHPILNSGQYKRDCDWQDFQVNGLPSQQTSTMAYVYRTWGAQPNSKIRGYDIMIGEVKSDDIREVSEMTARQRDMVLSVVRQTNPAVAAVTDITAAMLTDDVVKASGFYSKTNQYDTEAQRMAHARGELEAAIEDTRFTQQILGSVQRHTGRRVRHVDQLEWADITADVRADLGVDTPEGENTLKLRLAKTKLMHDVKRGAYIYLHTMFRKSRLDQSVDVKLRHRYVFDGGLADQTAKEMIGYELRAMATAEAGSLRVCGRPATEAEAEAIRRYAYAFKTNPQLVYSTKLMGSTQWQRINSPDMEDPAFTRERNMTINDMLLNLSSKEKEAMAAMVHEPTLNGETLVNMLANLERAYERRHTNLIRWSVKTSRETMELRNPWKEGEPTPMDYFTYDRATIEEWLKVSAPPNTPETEQDNYGYIRLLRLFGKYGDRLKQLRAVCDNPYAPLGHNLAFSPKNQAEREQMITEIAGDIFGKGEFGRIGKAIKDHAFQTFCEREGLDIKKEDSAEVAKAKKEKQEEAKKTWAFANESMQRAARDFYLFMQTVHAKYRGAGEEITLSNEWGQTGLQAEPADAGPMINALTSIDESGNVPLRVRPMTREEIDEKVRRPRERTPGYHNTVVMPGLSAEGAWANYQRGVSVLMEDPYAREYIKNIAANQAAYTQLIQERERGEVTQDRVQEILTLNGVSAEHEAATKMTQVMAGTRPFDIDDIETSLRDIKTNALRSTAAFYGLSREPEQLGILDEYMKEYSNAMLAQNRGNLREAINYLNRAYTQSKLLQYGEGAFDLRVMTLNTRGWAKKEYAEANPNKAAKKKGLQSSLDDFSAAWLTSRGEPIGDVLDENRPTYRLKLGWPPIAFPKLHRWLQDRFGFARREPRPEREDAEAMAGMGVVNSKLNNLSETAGDKTRGKFLGTSLVSGIAAVAGVIAAPFTGGASLLPALGAAAVSGLSLLPVTIAQRLRLGESWTRRAHDNIGDYNPGELNPDDSHTYISAYKKRMVGQSHAEALINSGDLSWGRFLRQNHGTFTWDRNLAKYNEALHILDPLTVNHILHASEATIGGGRDPLSIQNFYWDTIEARKLKRKAYESVGRHVEASYGNLANPTADETPEISRMYDVAQMAENRLKPENRGWWGTLLDATWIFSNTVGVNSAITNLVTYMDEHQTTTVTPGGATILGMDRVGPGFNNRSAQLLQRWGRHDKAGENTKMAIAKWTNLFQRPDQNNPIQTDVRSELIDSGYDRLFGETKPPGFEYRWFNQFPQAA
ncbi:MAG: hypothetical protein KKD39_05330 [Candidatus Altiarchaeota archaeon]|nr:hypothetical protein [Candidatus Altiarchaeota archaeon]